MGRRKTRRGGHDSIYYGMAIIVILFVIVGITSALQGKKDGKDSGMSDSSTLPGIKKAAEEVNNPDIRVLLMDTGYNNTVHPEVTLSSEAGLVLVCGEEEENWESAEGLTITPDDSRFEKGNIRVRAKQGEITVCSIQRGYGAPSYAGVLELRTTAEGIAMINELPVETYLCKVVPSEMPASYEAEALKAQAVCARSYAYRQMADYAYPEYEAHVNDSTDDQVYGNSESQEASSAAVQETGGQTVKYNGQIVTTYYYSTSCGKTASIEAWGTTPDDSNSYLQSVSVAGDDGDYEKELPWYQWEADVPAATLSNLVGLNTGTDVGMLSEVKVTKQGKGGVALAITATGEKGSVTVETENKIRRALGGSGYTITRQDGTEADSGALLPSAFFTIEKAGDTFIIKGGGFGHGIGMSQNGANEMAKQGKTYEEILKLFYQGVTVE